MSRVFNTMKAFSTESAESTNQKPAKNTNKTQNKSRMVACCIYLRPAAKKCKPISSEFHTKRRLANKRCTQTRETTCRAWTKVRLPPNFSYPKTANQWPNKISACTQNKKIKQIAKQIAKIGRTFSRVVW